MQGMKGISSKEEHRRNAQTSQQSIIQKIGYILSLKFLFLIIELLYGSNQGVSKRIKNIKQNLAPSASCRCRLIVLEWRKTMQGSWVNTNIHHLLSSSYCLCLIDLITSLDNLQLFNFFDFEMDNAIIVLVGRCFHLSGKIIQLLDLLNLNLYRLPDPYIIFNISQIYLRT